MDIKIKVNGRPTKQAEAISYITQNNPLVCTVWISEQFVLKFLCLNFTDEMAAAKYAQQLYPLAMGITVDKLSAKILQP